MLKIPRTYIVVPDTFANGSMDDGDLVIARIIAKVTNGTIIQYSHFNTNLKNILVVSIRLPSNTFQGDKILNLHNSTKLIYWIDDCQWRTDNNYKEIDAVLKKSNFILYANKIHFLSIWQKYAHKSQWLPFCLPSRFLNYQINQNAKNKCLLVGHCSCSHWYPIRYKVAKDGKKILGEKLDICPHPGYNHAGFQRAITNSQYCIGKKYADLLHAYECCVTDSSRTYGTLLYTNLGQKKFNHQYMRNIIPTLEETKKHGQVIKKYFEIPAVGSLLIADNATPDMEELGFIPSENFISVNEDNVLETIKKCLAYPQDYMTIRNNGLKMVTQNHTVKNRIKRLQDIMKNF